MYCMNFYAVNACFHAELCSLGESVNDLLDLLYSDSTAGYLRCPTCRQLTGACQLVGGVDDGLCNGAQHGIVVEQEHVIGDRPGAAHTCSHLHEELGAGLVDLVHKLL